MDAELRARFNAGWSPERARRVREDLRRRLGCALPFPIAETPIFLGEALPAPIVAGCLLIGLGIVIVGLKE